VKLILPLTALASAIAMMAVTLQAAVFSYL